jgi:murein DD-endopeptidase MepM/ murein hydrolase activator NlpD
MRKSLQTKFFVVLLIFSFFVLFFGYHFTYALTTTEIQAQIDAKQKEKDALDIENQKLQSEILKTSAQAQTLQTTIKVLDTTAKKLQSDLKVTTNKIDTTKLTIAELGIKINNTEKQITGNKQAINETLRSLYQIDDASFIQNLLQYKNINELWSAVESLHQFQTLVKQKTDDLAILEDQMLKQKTETEQKNKNLVSLKSQLASQKTVVDQNKQTKTTLLAVTKNQESLYQKMLQANIEKGRQFEQELFQFESQLNAQIDPSKIPSAHPGVLWWPLDSITITQRFGKTVDSRRLYVSGTHNGVDFRAIVGTPVKSVSDGVVAGIGNTDDQPGCYSYGRWILIQHGNGLSSLYAHLSAYSVSSGQTVRQGDVIGFSGGQPGAYGAGFSLGPHLHLGLFATQGVKIEKYTASKFCKNVSIPVVGGLNVYLDPLAYLPPLN